MIKKLCVVLLVVTTSWLPAGVCSAATYTIDAYVSAGWDYLGSPLTVPPFPGGTTIFNTGTAGYYQVDFYVNASGFDPSKDERGFGGVVFDINLTPGLADTTIPGWYANTSAYDPPGPASSVPLWDTNVDAGVGLDLVDIVVLIDVIPSPAADDPRAAVGQNLTSAQHANLVTPAYQPLWGTTGNQTYIGSLIVDWAGSTNDTLTVPFKQGLHAKISNGTLAPGTILQGAVITFAAPEPTSAAMLYCGGLIVLGLRPRRCECYFTPDGSRKR